MTHSVVAGGLALVLFCLPASMSHAETDAPFSSYSHADMEERFASKGRLPRSPSMIKESLATIRMDKAVRKRDTAALAKSARDLVVHASKPVAAGWRRSAAAWETLYEAFRAEADNRSHNWRKRRQARRNARHALQEAAYSLYAAYRSSLDASSAAGNLAEFARVLEARKDYIGAELALRESLDIAEDPEARAALDRVRKEHGFRIVGVRHDRDREDPRFCIALSAPIRAAQREHAADYIALEPSRGDHPVVLQESTICVGNLEHGVKYRLTLLDGLIDIHGREVVADARRLRVPDRPRSVRFAAGRYVMPRTGSVGVPLTTVNMAEVPLRLLRVTEGNLVDVTSAGRLGHRLKGYQLGEIVNLLGEGVWEGTIAVRNVRNRQVVTAVQLDKILPERRRGLYVLAATADNSDNPRYRDYAVQWLVVSDIGLSTVRGEDGLSVFARSLSSAKPMAGVTLSLKARNEDTLAELATDRDGRATFAPGLLRGSGGRAAVLLQARSEVGDHTLLRLTGPGFDLSDRGVGGRKHPDPVDAYVYTDRGIYRPGETVRLTALVRDDRGLALGGMPLLLEVFRPDRVPARSFTVLSDRGGAVALDHLLPVSAVTGEWRFVLSLPDRTATVGQARVEVQDFVPPRIEVDASVPPTLSPGVEFPLAIAARFYYGAPGVDLIIKGRMHLESDPEPFARWAGYRFGLVDREPRPVRLPLPDARTGQNGRVTLTPTAPAIGESTHPTRIRLQAAVLEPGGRPVGTTITRSVRDGRERVGLRPRFDGSVGLDTAAGFDVVLVDGGGQALEGRGLAWRLYRETREPFWYMDRHGRWKYRAIVMDSTVDSGEIETAASPTGVAVISTQPGWGTYRLEVSDPANRHVMPASVRFGVGWGRNDGRPNAPDMMTVRLDRKSYEAGEKAIVNLEAPFDGPASVIVATAGIEQVHRVAVVDGKAALAVPVSDWTAGANVMATAFRPAPVGAKEGPARAIGVAWLAVDQPKRRLSVGFDLPEATRSGKLLAIPFQVTDATGVPRQARLTIAAVDEAILRMTGFASPDPTGLLFGQRRMAVELRDLYGRILDARRGRPGAIRSGGDDPGGLLGEVQPPRRSLVLYHGLMDTDAGGRGAVTLHIPEGFRGRLRLMAVAHSRDALGSGAAMLGVRDPLMADLYLPRFLAPGDRAHIAAELVNAEAAAGDYRVSVSATGPVRIGGDLPRGVALRPGERRLLPLTLSATEPGVAVLRVEVSGPQDIRVERSWTLTVRPAQPWRQEQYRIALKPDTSLTLSEALVRGFHTAKLRVSVSASAVPYDMQGLLASLDRYPYGCTEQLISRALPLLYVAGLGPNSGARSRNPELDNRIRDAVRTVLSRQRPDGAFGLWSPRDKADPWLSAYALDFLERARSEGFAVDDAVLDRSRGFFAKMLNRYSINARKLEAAAYSLAALARAGAVEPGVVRRFAKTRLDDVRTGLGRAQVALAAHSFGLGEIADGALAAAMSSPGGSRFLTYGSRLRDTAAIAAVASRLGHEALGAATSRLRRLVKETGETSTQEKAWMVLAARELNRSAGDAPPTRDGAMTLDDRARFHRAVDPGELGGDGLEIRNAGDRPVELAISVGGHPMEEAPAVSKGVTIKRSVLTPVGEPMNSQDINQGDDLVVVLEGVWQGASFRRRLLVVDLLPAGLEIQAAITDGDRHPGLGEVDLPDTVRLRDDRYAAAVTRRAGEAFRLAYLVRAVTPGTYRVPAAYVEDMYAPAIRARGSMGRLTIRR